MISWLTRRFSRDPVQLGLFEVAPHTGDMPVRDTPVCDMPVCDTQVRDTRTHHAPRRGPDASARKTAATCDTTAATAQGAAMADPARLLSLLRTRGLRGVDRVVLTRNRRTMVSLAGGVLRVHEGFVAAPPEVQAAIATFATSRSRTKRAAARAVIVEYPVPIRAATRRPATQHPDDAPMAARLTMLHAQLNLEHFSGALAHIEVQVSRRLARRLGHYTPRAHTGGCGEIVLSRRHLRRDGWPEAIHTLLHEMVHQWQDETGRGVDHGPGFRAKCRAVGIEPAATRLMAR